MPPEYAGLSERTVIRVFRGAGPPRCCAFDLDGVLVDTDELHYVALNLALAQFGERIAREEHLATFKGLPTRVKCRMLTEAGRLGEASHPWVFEAKQRFTVDAIALAVRRDEGKVALLEAMVHDGWRLAVCSNAIHATVAALVKAVGVENLVDFALSNEDVERPKPNGEIYRKAAERFGVSPQDLIVVEDALNGRAAAEDAGCRLVAVEGPHEVGMDLLPRLCRAAE